MKNCILIFTGFLFVIGDSGKNFDRYSLYGYLTFFDVSKYRWYSHWTANLRETTGEPVPFLPLDSFCYTYHYYRLALWVDFHTSVRKNYPYYLATFFKVFFSFCFAHKRILNNGSKINIQVFWKKKKIPTECPN